MCQTTSKSILLLISFLVLGSPATAAECQDPNGLLTAVSVRPAAHPSITLVSSTTRADGVTEWHYQHQTDQWFDSPGMAGRAAPFAVTTPPGWDRDQKLPMLVVLHGGCGGYTDALGRMPQESEALVLYLDDENPPGSSGCAIQGRIHHVGYFTNHSAGVAGTPRGEIFVEYTLRRYRFEREFAVDEFNADPERVFVVGHSKGGAGALYQALLEPDVYAGVFADVPRVNIPVRGTESAQACNSEGRGWQSYLDTARLCEEDSRCLDQHIVTWAGRDDAAALWCYEHSASCGGTSSDRSWLERMLALPGGLQGYVWDESGHDRGRFGVCTVRADTPDPVLGCRWHDSGWDPMLDEVTFLRKDLSFPGFRRFTADDDPGAEVADRRCQGDVDVAGDTDCLNGGDLAGALNRWLRWDSTRVKDKKKKWAVTLWLLDDPGARGVEGSSCSSAPGYPSCYDDYDGEGVEKVDVIPRRLQKFRAAPGDTLRWKLKEVGGGKIASGKLEVAADGIVTIPEVEVSASGQRRLSIRRLKKAKG